MCLYSVLCVVQESESEREREREQKRERELEKERTREREGDEASESEQSCVGEMFGKCGKRRLILAGHISSASRSRNRRSFTTADD